MFDPTQERPIPLSQVPKLKWLPNRPHVATIFRWVQRGIRGYRLEVLRVGGTLCTSEARLLAFFERITNMSNSPVTTVTTSAARRRDADRVDRELDAAGIR